MRRGSPQPGWFRLDRSRLVFPILMVVMLALAGCSREPQVLTVTMTSFDYEPAVISVPPGATVRLLLDNPDTIPHTFDIPELGVGLGVLPEASVPYEFTVEDAGVYTFFCGIEGHQEAGMEGTLVVQVGN